MSDEILLAETIGATLIVIVLIIGIYWSTTAVRLASIRSVRTREEIRELVREVLVEKKS